ncbi:MAG: hypothetical protein QXL51_01300 [Candidatus Aenigmatarchaeota archaeon]
MPYRNMKVRMYYSKVATDYISIPFAEFRVFVITDEKVIIPEEVLDEILDSMEFQMQSIRLARDKNTIYCIEGREVNKEIDIAEAVRNLRTTGLDKPKFGEIYRYSMIFKPKQNKKYAYNEVEFIKLPFNRSDFIDWKTRKTRENVFRDDIKGLTMEEFEKIREEVEWL